jgi:hypothetical protein
MEKFVLEPVSGKCHARYEAGPKQHPKLNQRELSLL